MIKTTYTCDKCRHEQEDNDQMWEIGVVVQHHGHPAYTKEDPKVKGLWCRKCVEGLGLLPLNGGKPSDEPPPEPPSLEEMVREIVREEMLPGVS